MQRCESCGAVQLGRAPALRDTLALLRERGELTGREVADHFGIDGGNASNRLATLAAGGLATVVRTKPNPGGGVFNTYAPALSQPRIDPQVLAVHLEGGSSPGQRARIINRMGADDDIREVVGDAAAILGEMEAEDGNLLPVARELQSGCEAALRYLRAVRDGQQPESDPMVLCNLLSGSIAASRRAGV